MPSVKRWFHLNQELNRDPEFREYAKKFGLGGVRFWLEALAILDRTDNFWDLRRGFDLGLLAGSCETKRHIIQGSYEHLRDINWLRVGVDPNQKLFIYAPKWVEYNKRREDKGSKSDTTREQVRTYPTPTPSPTPILKKEEEKRTVSYKPKRTASREFEDWWEDLKNNPAYQHVNFEIELGKMQAWLKKPCNAKKKLTYQRVLNWLNKVEVSFDLNGTSNGSAPPANCTRRILSHGVSKQCQQLAVHFVGKSGMCESCHEVYQHERAALKQLETAHEF